MFTRTCARLVAATFTCALAAAGCPDPPDDPDADTSDPADTSADADTADGSSLPPVQSDPGCDPLVTSRCALPWPSDKYLAPDSERPTDYTLAFDDRTLPAAVDVQTTDPSAYRRLDGYGLGTPIMLAYDNLDPSQFPDETAIEQSVADDATILLYRVDGDSLTRVPYWAELDDRADDDAATKMLIVRPAVVLEPNTRYIVALRDLRHADGSPVESSPAFRRLRADAVPSDSPLADRSSRFDTIFDLLADAGVDPAALTVAWDFHTASHDALHGPMVRMRDRGLDATGPEGPELTIDDVERFVPSSDGSGRPTDDDMALRIEGSFRVPRFVQQSTIRGSSGWTLHRDDSGRVTQNGWKQSPFWMIVPHSAINDDPAGSTAPGNGEPHGLVQYGHGLLGTGAQTDGGFNQRIADDHDFIFFGSNLFGMAASDQQTAIDAVSDISRFPLMADRLHQGMLEYLLLMRAMQERLADTSLADDYGLKIDPGDSYYSGISQGGIFGGTYMALSQDVVRGHLGVPGNNYSTLLGRSANFEPFFVFLRSAYRNRLDQLIALAAIQLLWGQTDPVSYLRHIKKHTLPNTPAHDVLLAPAKGDHQVAVVTNEVAARSDNGIDLMANYPKDVALVDKQPFPHSGSGVVLYDFGNPWPSPGNHPPAESTDDPHGKPRQAAWHNRQMVHFFRNGEIINTCDDDGDPVCDPQ